MNEVRNVATFHNAIFAVRANRPVKILAIGDQEGKSPVYLCVDEQGKSTWQSTTEFTIIDSNALPNVNPESLGRLTSSGR
jgi:hypothetical protein